MPRKLPPIPAILISTPCTITAEAPGISTDGEPVIAFTWTGLCRYSDKAKEFLSGDKKLVRLSGAIQINGDIAPGLPSFTGGSVEIAGNVFKIHAGKRPRNPDGSVHHTTLELI